MQVPSRFKLGGRTWKVEIVESLHDEEGQLVWGLCHCAECRIELRATDDAEQLEHTFWHEAMHAVCTTLGYHKLNSDEDKIDALAGMVMQIIDTKKGEAE